MEIQSIYDYYEETTYNHFQEYTFNNNKIGIYFGGKKKAYSLKYITIEECDKDFNIFIKNLLELDLIKDFSTEFGVNESLLNNIKNILNGLYEIDNIVYSEHGYTLTGREITYYDNVLKFRISGNLTFEFDIINKCFIYKVIDDDTYITYIKNGIAENYTKSYYNNFKEALFTGDLHSKEAPNFWLIKKHIN